MISIKDKTECCGCGACKQVCRRNCISMICDNQGFAYPVVDTSLCVDCHLCEKICPVINKYESKEKPLSCYLSKTKNDRVRTESSSGGIFSEIANEVIKQGGVVFGVQFDQQWQVIYSYTEEFKGIAPYRGSKYVQADTNDCYKKVELFLKSNRLVLFCGTPCYVAGLKHYLQKDYSNLLTIDFVCHSIPSPLVWKLYMQDLEKRNGNSIKRVSFRDKSNGWSNYSLMLDFGDKKILESHFENLYMRGFSSDIFTRPSCSNCPARNFSSGSDITLADAWAINNYHPEMNDEKGLSHVLVNSQTGVNLFRKITDNIEALSINYVEVEPTRMHLPLTASCRPNPMRSFFYKGLNRGGNISMMIALVLSIDQVLHITKKAVKKMMRLTYKRKDDK